MEWGKHKNNWTVFKHSAGATFCAVSFQHKFDVMLQKMDVFIGNSITGVNIVDSPGCWLTIYWASCIKLWNNIHDYFLAIYVYDVLLHANCFAFSFISYEDVNNDFVGLFIQNFLQFLGRQEGQRRPFKFSIWCV